MQFKKFENVNEFYNATYDLLMDYEAQNIIPLGNIIIGNEGKDKTDWRDPTNWFMATVSNETGIQITAIMTPPHNLAIYATNNIIDSAAIDCLIDGIAGHPIPGVIAEKTLANFFAKAYTIRKGMTFKVSMDQRIYELTKVNQAIPQIGTLRLLEERDMYFFPFWAEGFYAAAAYGCTTMQIPTDAEKYRYHITEKNVYVLEDKGMPVSIAGFSRAMQTVIGIGRVFTPPYFRGKGYASSCVAQVSQIALDKGYTKCVLYTDLANPTSNSIYQKIGYNPICDSLMLKFM